MLWSVLYSGRSTALHVSTQLLSYCIRSIGQQANSLKIGANDVSPRMELWTLIPHNDYHFKSSHTSHMSEICISLPSSPSASPPRELSKPTNTLVVTSLPRELFHEVALNALRRHFGSYGKINRWVPLGGFGRIIIVYHDEYAAETAKLESDPVVLEATEDR